MKNNQYLKLTNPQKSIYYTEKLYSGTSISNISGTMRMKQKINFDILNDAINLVIKNNDAMRTNFKIVNNELQQYFIEYEKYHTQLIDVENENDLEILINKLCQTPFDISEKYMFRFTFFRFPDGSGGCNIIHSHLISDAWSSTIICTQLVDNYINLLNNREIDKSKIYSYKDYIVDENEYMQSEKYKKDTEFWKDKYTTVHELATLSTDNIEKVSSKANRIEYIINKKDTEKINKFCEGNGISAYVFFLTVYSIYISRVTKLDYITLGTPILNRKNVKDKKVFIL